MSPTRPLPNSGKEPQGTSLDELENNVYNALQEAEQEAEADSQRLSSKDVLAHIQSTLINKTC